MLGMSRPAYAFDLTNEQWTKIEAAFPAAKNGHSGRTRASVLRPAMERSALFESDACLLSALFVSTYFYTRKQAGFSGNNALRSRAPFLTELSDNQTHISHRRSVSAVP